MGGDEMFLRNAPRRSELTRAKSAEWISSTPQEALIVSSESFHRPLVYEHFGLITAINHWCRPKTATSSVAASAVPNHKVWCCPKRRTSLVLPSAVLSHRRKCAPQTAISIIAAVAVLNHRIECGREDLNLQGLPHRILSPACLPVSPRPHNSLKLASVVPMTATSSVAALGY